MTKNDYEKLKLQLESKLPENQQRLKEVPTANTTADCWGTQGDEIPIDPWEVIK